MRDVDVARVCHEANRALQLLAGDPAPSPAWDDAPQWQRDSAVEGVAHARNGISPAELHERWAAAKRRAGWRYGEVKDPDERTHPCLVPYAILPEAERRKDAVFGAIVRALTADG